MASTMFSEKKSLHFTRKHHLHKHNYRISNKRKIISKIIMWIFLIYFEACLADKINNIQTTFVLIVTVTFLVFVFGSVLRLPYIYMGREDTDEKVWFCSICDLFLFYFFAQLYRWASFISLHKKLPSLANGMAYYKTSLLFHCKLTESMNLTINGHLNCLLMIKKTLE